MFSHLKKFITQEQSFRSFSKLAREHPLKYLFLEITRKCNLDCVYCGSNCSPKGLGRELPAERWIDLLREIARDFNPRQVMLAITGGEPLLKPGLFDFLKQVSSLGFPFGMVTNGTLLNPEAAKKIVDSGLGSISLSLDAPPEINDQLRGNGTSRKVEQAIKNLREAGYRGKLEVISTITKPAVPHLEELRRWLAGMLVPLWRLLPVMPIGRATGRADLIPDPMDLKIILDFIEAGRSDRLLPQPEFGEEGYLGEKYEGVVRPYRFQCRAGLTVGGIFFDGKIGACPELGDAFVQGHVDRDNFRKVWDERYQLFRDRSWTRKDACADCDAFKTCGGGSLHLYQDPHCEFSRCFYLMLAEAK